MRTSRPILIFIVTLAAWIPVIAEQPPANVIAQAATLTDQGHFHAALDLLEPLIAPDAHINDKAAVGLAWNLRGLAYQNLGDLDQARRSYETAISLLRNIPERPTIYASALDNLGSLYDDFGRAEESKTLRLKALRLYDSAGDHAGTARTSGNLALVAISQDRRKQAQRFLDRAFHEESLVPTPDIGDLAAIYSIQAVLSARNRDNGKALTSVDNAMRLWTEHYGPAYYLLAIGYSQRGQLNDRLGYQQQAVDDMQHALRILRQDNDSNSRVYFKTESIYARVLAHAGQKSEASRIENEARTSLDSLRRQSCASCTVNVESFR